MKAKFIFTAILALFASAALAGEYAPMPVSIDFDARIASGDMLSARFSYDDRAAIGCGVTGIDDEAGGAFQYGFCEATNSDGNSISCFTLNPALIDSIAAISDFSLLFFCWHEDGVSCQEIGTYTKSSFLGKPGKHD